MSIHRPSLVNVVVAAAIALVVGTTSSSQERQLRGFPSGEAATEEQWESKFRALPSSERLKEYQRAIAQEPHHAGSAGSKRVADYVLAKFKEWGLNAWIEPFEAYMPMPQERVVELVAPEQYTAKLQEPVVDQDPDTGDAGQLPTFNAYSADGDVTADLVYVNYGIPEDYEVLQTLGIDVKGKIVIARYGNSWRGIKPKVAWEHGAVGCLIYSDPRDDGYYQGEVYPDGGFRPWQGVQRGSVMDMPVYPGDPLTPGWGGVAGSRKLAVAEAKTLLKIPVLPISYGDALPLLRNLKGPVAPVDWRGALPITYRVGPGPAKVHLKLTFEWKLRPLYNVIARIDGAVFPNQWIVQGNHHDGWVNGANDPTTGNVALMETARAFGELAKQGWKPKRTIIFGSWDGEEWGLLGSTEWGEQHASELREKGVVYINTDSNGRGWLSASGSHSLEALVSEVARAVMDPKSGRPIFTEARDRDIRLAPSDERKKQLAARTNLEISALGSGSDYTVFLDHLTMASLNVGFSGLDQGGGLGHSIYDTVASYARFSDGEFLYGRTLSQTVGTLLMRLANASVLPFEFTTYVRTIAGYVDDIEREHGKRPGAPALRFSDIRLALGRLGRSAEAYEKAVGRVAAVPAQTLASRRDELGALNRIIYTTERAFRHEAGLPSRDWFKHVIYAPGLYTGYGVKTLPGIREGVERGAWDEASAHVALVTSAIDTLARQLDEATRLLDGLLK